MLDFQVLSQALSKIRCVVLPIEGSLYKKFQEMAGKATGNLYGQIHKHI